MAEIREDHHIFWGSNFVGRLQTGWRVDRSCPSTRIPSTPPPGFVAPDVGHRYSRACRSSRRRCRCSRGNADCGMCFGCAFRAHVFGMTPAAARACEKKVEYLRKRHTKLRWLQLDIGIDTVHFGQGFIPVGIEVVRSGVDALVMTEFGQW